MVWPFSKPPLSVRDPDSAAGPTDAQVEQFFEEESRLAESAGPSPGLLSRPSSSTTAADGRRSAPAAPSQRREHMEADVPSREPPCALQYYFDEFFMCYTPKSQLVHYYRHGHQKDCRERWRDFSWCLKTRVMATEDESQAMLKQRRLERLAELRKGPNSERVWEIREKPLTDPWNTQNATMGDGEAKKVGEGKDSIFVS